MRELPITFTSCGFDYVQESRDGRVAIYRQTERRIGSVRFEVVKIQRHHKSHFGMVKGDEYYPSSGHWGDLGFTCLTLERARERAKEMA